jgi:hypothetical protein
MLNQLRNSRTKRRSPENGPPMPLDECEDLASIPAATPAFDLAWTRDIIDEALRRVEQNCRGTDRTHYWMLFEDRIVNPLLHGREPLAYSQFVARLGFRSPMQASNALFTTKRMFERFFQDVVREYAGDDCCVEKEIAELRAILAEASG